MTALLVATPGGHVAELHALAPRLSGLEDRVWATWPTEQTRSLLRDEQVIWISTIGPRDAAAVAKTFPAAIRAVRRVRPSVVVSTGSGIALPFLTCATALWVPCAYIESATRLRAPSLTGRLLARVPRMRLFTQYDTWADSRWRYIGSVYDAFRAEPRPQAPKRLRNIVVTLGTMRDYKFERLLERLVELIPSDARVVWQTGCTPGAQLGIDARPWIPSDELASELREADLVIGHAGAGTALDALSAGHVPVLVPRRHARGENVDDHQLEVAARST